MCLGLFHVKCLPNHTCFPPPLKPNVIDDEEESDTENMSDLSQPPNTSISLLTPHIPQPSNIFTTATASTTSHLSSSSIRVTSSSVMSMTTTTVSTLTLLAPFQSLSSQTFTQNSLRPSAIPFTPTAVSSSWSLSTPLLSLSIPNPNNLLPQPHQHYQYPPQQQICLFPPQQPPISSSVPSLVTSAALPFPPPTISQSCSLAQPSPAQPSLSAAQKSRPPKKGLSGPALTPDSLALELSHRALTMCKEELAMKDSQLLEATTKSKVLTDRVRILEEEVNRLLAAEHLPGTQPTAQPQQAATSADGHHCLQLVTEVDQIKEQLQNLCNTFLHPSPSHADTHPTILSVPMPANPPPPPPPPPTIIIQSTPPLYQQQAFQYLPPLNQQQLPPPPLQSQYTLPYPQKEQHPLLHLGYARLHEQGYTHAGGYSSDPGVHTPALGIRPDHQSSNPPSKMSAPSVPHHNLSPQPHVPSPLSDIQKKLMALAGQSVPQQNHLPPLHQQQRHTHVFQQQQAQPLPLPVPLMSIKVPFPKHLRTHPRVRPQHPRIPRNKLFAHRSPQVDPNPIINNLISLNY